jgi:hypothetical protein
MGKQRTIAAIELQINQEKRPFRTEGIEITYCTGFVVQLGKKPQKSEDSGLLQQKLVKKLLAPN